MGLDYWQRKEKGDCQHFYGPRLGNRSGFSFAQSVFFVIFVPMRAGERREVGIYVHKPAELKAYEPVYPEVAKYIANLIQAELTSVIVEHIGSTAIANCDGKGIIDVMVLYPEDHLEDTKEMLFSLGFQPQPHKDPFPDDRPMLVGSISYNNKVFQIHVHVIQQGHPEALTTIEFRDRLRKADNLRKGYIRCKMQILQRGIADSLEYCKAKQSFIEKVLAEGFK